MTRLFLDEDSQSKALVEALRRAGFDVLTVNEAGRRGFTDTSQLEFAAEQRRAIVSANVGDFSALHTEWLRTSREHFGILLRTNQFLRVGEEVAAIVAATRSREADLRNVIKYLSNYHQDS